MKAKLPKVLKTYKADGSKEFVAFCDAFNSLEPQCYKKGTVDMFLKEWRKDGKPFLLASPFAFYEFS